MCTGDCNTVYHVTSNKSSRVHTQTIIVESAAQCTRHRQQSDPTTYPGSCSRFALETTVACAMFLSMHMLWGDGDLVVRCAAAVYAKLCSKYLEAVFKL